MFKVFLGWTLSAAALLGFAAGAESQAPSSLQRTNIILILSDDVGVETVTAYGGESYQTPELDRLAADGIRFDYAHAQPLCTPSRVKLMTGRYNFRNYEHFMMLKPGETTFAQLMKQAGYRTLVAGKWQLVDNGFESIEGTYPEQAGFDEHILWQVRRENKGSRYWGPTITMNGEFQKYDDAVFGPDLFNQYVLNFIDRNLEQPFFIYYPMVLAHEPFVATPDSPDHDADAQARFAGMMAYMDKLVGKVRAKVEEAGIADHTLILFLGDNGTPRKIHSVRNGRSIKGGKGLTTNAGSHVPFIAWWPGKITRGRTSDALVNLNDFFPTFAEIAAVPLPPDDPRDGMSLLPTLRGDGEIDRQTLFIHYDPKWFHLSGRYALDRQWKLYEDGDFFNTAQDPEEKAALDVSRLDGATAQAYERLKTRIDEMPGGPLERARYIPPVIYKAAFGVLAAVVVLGWVVIRHLNRWRRDRRRING